MNFTGASWEICREAEALCKNQSLPLISYIRANFSGLVVNIDASGRLTDIDTLRKWQGMAQKLNYKGDRETLTGSIELTGTHGIDADAEMMILPST